MELRLNDKLLPSKKTAKILSRACEEIEEILRRRQLAAGALPAYKCKLDCMHCDMEEL
jgi:MoaA/NifB/PqqE/SkfB family radical SAM enzyme